MATTPLARHAGGVAVRPIEGRDDAPLALLIREVMTEFGAQGPGSSLHDPEVAAMSKAYAGPRHAFFVAERGGVLLGGGGIGPLQGGAPEVCELRKMYLLPAARGLGLGRRLLDACLAAARARGYRRCYLETMCSMTDAQRLYERAGFARLAQAEGATGHSACNTFFALDLRS